PMTLHDCMEYAISNATKIRIQQAAIGDAQIDRRDAALALFTPQINANTYFHTTSFHNGYSVSAGYDLFDGFKAVNNYKISKTGMLIAASQEKQVEADIWLAVMEAYYNVVYYKRLCDVYEEQVATAEQALVKARRQEEVGQKGHADVIQMEADLADRQYELTNISNMYRDQLMTLSDLMFWPLDEELAIDTGMPGQAGHDGFVSSGHDGLSSLPAATGNLATESVVDFALEHNPAVQIASWQQQNARRELNTAKWQLLPTVGLYAGWNTSYYSYQGASTNPFWSQFRNNGGEYLQVSLSIPIWNRMSKHSAIGRKQHALDKATAEYDQKRRDVESEVRRAVQDRDGAELAFERAQYKAEVQEEAYTLNLKKLEQGLISPLEFQTANNNYLKARADEMNSLFKYLIKQAVVKYYNGIEYINQ
ncbi:MAG: TolC family protein, partial [Bacteroidales bacterium]|nr:TolC family protein [Bacteroidales bacterium]